LLAHGGIVQAVVGRSGGYRLARPAGGISVLDVVAATQPRPPAGPPCVLHQGASPHEGARPVPAKVVAAREDYRAKLRAERRGRAGWGSWPGARGAPHRPPDG